MRIRGCSAKVGLLVTENFFFTKISLQVKVDRRVYIVTIH